MAYDIGKPVPRKRFNPATVQDFISRTPVTINDGTVTGTLSGTNTAGEYNWMKTGISGTTPAGRTTSALSRIFSPANINKALTKGAKIADKISPFASNIVNAFRKPPMPARLKPDIYTSLQKVDFSDQRNKVRNNFAAAARSTERNLPSNASEAVKAFNKGQEFNQISNINETETNTNVAISNKQAEMDAVTSARNTAKDNQYSQDLVERRIAQQREQSANIANAGDKLMMIKNENTKRDTEIAKAKVLASGLYGKSGVLKRSRIQMKQDGLPDPLGINYSDLMYGGKIPKKLY